MSSENNHSKQLTRRTILRGAAVTAGAFPILLAGINAAHAAKASQKSVGYQDTPKGAQSCDNCRLFVAPADCKTVEGPVSPKGWCRVYVKK